jgi:hypothetical protein
MPALAHISMVCSSQAPVTNIAFFDSLVFIIYQPRGLVLMSAQAHIALVCSSQAPVTNIAFFE